MCSSCSIRSSRHKTLRKKCVLSNIFPGRKRKIYTTTWTLCGNRTWDFLTVRCCMFVILGTRLEKASCVNKTCCFSKCGQLVFAGLTVDLHVSIPHKNKGCFLFSWTKIYIWFLLFFFFLNNKPTSVLLLKPFISTSLETMAGKAKQEKDGIQWLFLSKMKLPRAPCDSQTDQSSDQLELEFGEQSEHCSTVWSHATVWSTTARFKPVSKSHSHPINTLPAVKEADMLVTSWTRWYDKWQVFSELSKLMKEHINVYAFRIWISRLSIWNKTKTCNLGPFCLEIPNPWLHLSVSIK